MHDAQAEPTTTEEPTEQFAVVEIFGHREHAGRIKEVEQFGTKMLRIDVPKRGDDGEASFENGYDTMFYGGSSVFSMTPTTLATVIKMNKGYPKPSLRELAPPEEHEDEEQDEELPY